MSSTSTHALVLSSVQNIAYFVDFKKMCRLKNRAKLYVDELYRKATLPMLLKQIIDLKGTSRTDQNCTSGFPRRVRLGKFISRTEALFLLHRKIVKVRTHAHATHITKVAGEVQLCTKKVRKLSLCCVTLLLCSYLSLSCIVRYLCPSPAYCYVITVVVIQPRNIFLSKPLRLPSRIFIQQLD